MQYRKLQFRRFRELTRHFDMGYEADLFLTTAGENEKLAVPRACWVKGRLKDHVRDDYMLIRIDPPLVGQGFGFGDRDIFDLIISTRFEGASLFPITEWPSHVYVSRILDEEIVTTLVLRKDQVELVAWGMLFKTLDEANAQAKTF
jgi:hypothetical protein